MKKISILKKKETVRHNLVLDVDVVFYIFNPCVTMEKKKYIYIYIYILAPSIFNSINLITKLCCRCMTLIFPNMYLGTKAL